MNPEPGETQPQFAIRWHAAFANSIPDTTDRNRQMLQVWRAHAAKYDPVARIAAEKFGRDQFELIEDVPVFSEHETTHTEVQNGQKVDVPVTYGRDELVALVERNNQRAIDRGMFAPLSEGHTPRDPYAPYPAVLGYVGNFRLGQVGRTNPVWAIFEDEYHHKEDLPTTRKLIRRSPEVWRTEGFFDPVAALGSRTPRLDSGQAMYCMESAAQPARLVEKYMMADIDVPQHYMATMPSAGSTFPPGGISGRANYEGGGAKPDRQQRLGSITPDDLGQIIDALMETEPMRWVAAQMQSGPDMVSPENTMPEEAPDAPPGQPGPMDGQQPPGAGPPMGGPPGQEALPGAGPPMNGNQPPAAAAPGPPQQGGNGMSEYDPTDEDRAKVMDYMAGKCSDDDMTGYLRQKRDIHCKGAGGQQYMGGQHPPGQYAKPEPTTPAATPTAEPVTEPRRGVRSSFPEVAGDAYAAEQYAKAVAERDQLKEELKQALADSAKLQLDMSRNVRDAELYALRREYAFELEKEREACAPERMTDEQYLTHRQSIIDNYQKLPVDVPDLDLRDSLLETSDSTAGGEAPDDATTEKAMHYALEANKKHGNGKHVSFDDAVQYVREHPEYTAA